MCIKVLLKGRSSEVDMWIKRKLHLQFSWVFLSQCSSFSSDDGSSLWIYFLLSDLPRQPVLLGAFPPAHRMPRNPWRARTFCSALLALRLLYPWPMSSPTSCYTRHSDTKGSQTSFLSGPILHRGSLGLTEGKWLYWSAFSRETETVGDIQICKEEIYYRNSFMPFWRQGSPTICHLQAGELGRLSGIIPSEPKHLRSRGLVVQFPI